METVPIQNTETERKMLIEQIKELEKQLQDAIQCRQCSAKTELPDGEIGCRAKERIKELEAHIKLLSPYADHLPHCQGMVDSFTLDCNCGLERALKG